MGRLQECVLTRLDNASKSGISINKIEKMCTYVQDQYVEAEVFFSHFEDSLGCVIPGTIRPWFFFYSI